MFLLSGFRSKGILKRAPQAEIVAELHAPGASHFRRPRHVGEPVLYKSSLGVRVEGSSFRI